MSKKIYIKRLSTGLWHAIEYQGSAQLPVTVASMSKTPDGVLASVKARQAAGIIEADAEIMFTIDSDESFDELLGHLVPSEEPR